MIRKTLAAALLASALTIPAIAAEGTLKIVSIDMEGGGGTLFVTPEGKSLLIDTGWPGGAGLLPSPDGAQNSADRIAAAAKKLGLSKIDYLLITHYHLDHVGGVQELVKRIPVGTFVDHGPTVEGPVSTTLREQVPGFQAAYAELYGKAKHQVVKPGDLIPITGLTWRIVTS